VPEQIPLTPKLRTELPGRRHASGYVGKDGAPPAAAAVRVGFAWLAAAPKLPRICHHTFRHTAVTVSGCE
jgi:hypothetical protein